MRAFAHLGAAATYLGIGEDALRTSLAGGKTLAQVAQDKHKSVDGLVSALVTDETKELDAAVAAGKLTKAQRDSIVSGLKERITALVNGERPAGGPGRHGRFGFGPPASVPGGDSGFGGGDDAPPAAA